MLSIRIVCGNHSNYEINLTSLKFPTDGARGNIASPGTKKTGSHFASQLDPGVRTVDILSAKLDKPTLSKPTSATKIKQHPPSILGNAMEKCLKVLRKATSSSIKMATLMYSFFCLFERNPPRVYNPKDVASSFK
mmetsp:Transcript_38210/g.38585  ORF Transcript_38210/g.38585 Transcript_38210/m.38585 type:complete len:135 (-) Transcript_38210:280-684(-)